MTDLRLKIDETIPAGFVHVIDVEGRLLRIVYAGASVDVRDGVPCRVAMSSLFFDILCARQGKSVITVTAPGNMTVFPSMARGDVRAP